MEVVAWRMLETYAETLPRCEQVSANARDASTRLRESCPRALEQPAHHPAGEPLALEVYFAWAALCLAAATLGIRVSPDDCAKSLKLVDELNALSSNCQDQETLKNEYRRMIQHSSLFAADTADAVIRAATKASSLYNEIPSDHNMEQVAE